MQEKVSSEIKKKQGEYLKERVPSLIVTFIIGIGSGILLEKYLR